MVNKPELIRELSKKTNLSKKEVGEVLATFTEVIKEQLAKGEKVRLSGFGVFETSRRKARRGVDPRTGKEIIIPEMELPRFRAGQDLKKHLK